MRPFHEIEQAAIARKGSEAALSAALVTPKPRGEIAAIANDRWLSEFSKSVFQAGFSWKVIESKWPRFEEVFDGFDIGRLSMMHDEDVERLLKVDGIVAHGPKIKSIGENARFLRDLADKNGSVGAFFASWKLPDYCDNLRLVQKGGSRLGGKTGQVALRRIGMDTPIFSNDVIETLKSEGVVTKMPSSNKDFALIQAALDQWHKESGRPLTQISQILAFSAG
ncbi:DNA-3-methyladenine glycosylase I [uncultured Thalassospira sp.]|uniref:DNA-3-methyladenine glycosylase I n=1 Tax=uncultured Thalassospira sp. TaxID=404382 RepID=UPI002586639B|nr:DNA-3-methyladenine glycosylase I [uncultured Thalassospira sp.]